MLKKLKYPVSLLMLWGLIHSLFITYDGLHDEQHSADVGIVLGAMVRPDGSLSEQLKGRLDHTVTLYQQKRIRTVIVSGGLGKEGFWEGEKMREYLISQHLPAEKIFVDNFGNDTELTVQNSLRLMQEHHFHSAISISQYFHQTRIKMLFRKAGFSQISSSSPALFLVRDFYSIPREFVAFYVEWFK